MITLLHGDNLLSSYNYLQKLKAAFSGEIVTLEAKTLTPKLLEEIAGQQALFTSTKLVIIEGQPKKEVLPTLDSLSGQELLIWVDKKITPPKIQAKVLEFKDTGSNANFRFGDNFAARDLKASLVDFQTLVEDKIPMELVIGLLHRQLRLMIMLQDGETAGINPYVASKIKPQLKKWQGAELVAAIEKLLLVDHQIKTGRIRPETSLINYLTQVL
jgi:hypothetical protein